MRVNGAFAAHHLHLGEHAGVTGGIAGNVAKVSDTVALAGAKSTKGLVCEFTSPLFITLQFPSEDLVGKNRKASEPVSDSCFLASWNAILQSRLTLHDPVCDST
jgi:hypothetical protein